MLFYSTSTESLAFSRSNLCVCVCQSTDSWLINLCQNSTKKQSTNPLPPVQRWLLLVLTINRIATELTVLFFFFFMLFTAVIISAFKKPLSVDLIQTFLIHLVPESESMDFFLVFGMRKLARPHHLTSAVEIWKCLTHSTELDHEPHHLCLQISFPLQSIKIIQWHALKHWCIMHFVPLFKLSWRKSA